MARIFTCGFEDGSLGSTVLSEGGANASTAQKRTGTYSLDVGTNKGASILIPGSPAEGYIRVGVYLTQGGSDRSLVLFYDSLSTRLFHLNVSETGVPTFYLYGGAISSPGTVPIPLNAWSCMELYYKIADAPTGRLTLKVGGVASIDVTGDTHIGSIADVSVLHFGHKGGVIFGCTGYIDDIAINDTTGSVNNSWIGRGGVYLCPISGAGTVTGMTPSAGSNYACVDEVPASDTDYVSSADVADIDLYTIDTSALPTPIRVDAVKLGYRAKVDAGGANLVPVLRSESTTEEQTDDALAMSTSYTVQSVNYDVDPVDDAPWDATKLAALEVGQRKGL